MTLLSLSDEKGERQILCQDCVKVVGLGLQNHSKFSLEASYTTVHTHCCSFVSLDFGSKWNFLAGNLWQGVVLQGRYTNESNNARSNICLWGILFLTIHSYQYLISLNDWRQRQQQTMLYKYITAGLQIQQCNQWSTPSLSTTAMRPVHLFKH